MYKAYKVEKCVNSKWTDYGNLPAEDAKAIVRGYKKSTHPEHTKFYPNADELEGIYIRKGTENFYTIERAY